MYGVGASQQPSYVFPVWHIKLLIQVILSVSGTCILLCNKNSLGNATLKNTYTLFFWYRYGSIMPPIKGSLSSIHLQQHVVLNMEPLTLNKFYLSSRKADSFICSKQKSISVMLELNLKTNFETPNQQNCCNTLADWWKVKYMFFLI